MHEVRGGRTLGNRGKTEAAVSPSAVEGDSFTDKVFHACMTVNCCSFKMNMNKNSVKYLQNISCLSLTFAEKSEIKSLGHKTPDLVISQTPASRNQNYCRNFNISIYSKCSELLSIFSSIFHLNFSVCSVLKKIY